MRRTEIGVHPGDTAAFPNGGADAVWIAGHDGQRLYSRWLCPLMPPRGVVWYVLGAECGAAVPYPLLTRALVDRGLVVALVHARATGYSPGVRGDVADHRAVLGDYGDFRLEIERRFPGLPVFLLGHSAGAALAAHVAANGTPPVAGVVLVNPAYRLRRATGMTPTWRQYVAFAANLLVRPSAPVVDMNSQPLAIAFGPDRDDAMAMRNDPLVVRRFSMRALLAQKRLMDRLPEHVAALSAPLLLVEGAHDALVDPAGNDELFARAPTSASTRLLVPDGGHGSSAVKNAVDPLLRWFEARLAPRDAASGTDAASLTPAPTERRENEGGPMAINLRRVLTAGLVAGLVISLSPVTMVPVVGDQMDAALRARGVPPLTVGAMVYFVAQSFVTGVLLVWLYAAVQPRLRPGPKTAALAALFVWLVGGFAANVSNVMYGFMPVPLTVVGTLWALAELLIAGQVGARIYRDV